MKGLTVVDYIALVLVLVGGLNWGLVGFFDVNLISLIFGDATVITRVLYALVGLAAVYTIFFLAKCGKG